jgi:hypothetical protein
MGEAMIADAARDGGKELVAFKQKETMMMNERAA